MNKTLLELSILFIVRKSYFCFLKYKILIRIFYRKILRVEDLTYSISSLFKVYGRINVSASPPLI